VISALFSPAAGEAEGVSLDDRYWPLDRATNLPGPVRPGGPPIWLGVGKPRGIALAARYATGWPMPGNRPGDLAYFSELRDRLCRALETAGRDPGAFAFAAQLAWDPTLQLTDLRKLAVAFVQAGATHVILGLPASAAPDGLRRLATDVAVPLLEAAKR